MTSMSVPTRLLTRPTASAPAPSLSSPPPSRVRSSFSKTEWPRIDRILRPTLEMMKSAFWNVMEETTGAKKMPTT